MLKKEEEEEEAPPPPRVAPPPSVSAPMPQQQQQPISAADAARLAALLQAELLRQQPSMRPDAGGYDPIRYDHPYVRQLGVSNDCENEWCCESEMRRNHAVSVPTGSQNGIGSIGARLVR